MLTMTGRMWVIWPVNSKTMTEVEIVWVTLPDKAAAPSGVENNIDAFHSSIVLMHFLQTSFLGVGISNGRIKYILLPLI